MDEQTDRELAEKKQRAQMLKLVAKDSYNELLNYSVRKEEIDVARTALFKSVWLQIFSAPSANATAST